MPKRRTAATAAASRRNLEKARKSLHRKANSAYARAANATQGKAIKSQRKGLAFDAIASGRKVKGKAGKKIGVWPTGVNRSR